MTQTTKKYLLKISPILIVLGIFLNFNAVAQAQAQSCNSLKEILENSEFCDKNEISVHGRVYELLDKQTLSGSKYVYSFQITDNGQYIVRVVSVDDMLLIKGAEVLIEGRYYKKLYADGLNLDDTIVASSKDIKVILTADELWNEILDPWSLAMDKEKSLQRRIIILVILIPLFSVIAFVFSYIFYKRKLSGGRKFEDYVENLFNSNEWDIEESHKFKNLKRWIKSYSNPDFVFAHKRTNKRIAVECKYKLKEYDNFFWAYEDQIENYQNFSQKQNIPVFVVLGISGRPKNPKRMFLVPLNSIKYPMVKIEYLKKFERNPQKHFLLDNQGNLL